MQLSEPKDPGHCGSRTNGGRAASAEHLHVDRATTGCTREASRRAPLGAMTKKEMLLLRTKSTVQIPSTKRVTS